MKYLSLFVLLSVIILTACGNEDSNIKSNVSATVQSDTQTQTESSEENKTPIQSNDSKKENKSEQSSPPSQTNNSEASYADMVAEATKENSLTEEEMIGIGKEVITNYAKYYTAKTKEEFNTIISETFSESEQMQQSLAHTFEPNVYSKAELIFEEIKVQKISKTAFSFDSVITTKVVGSKEYISKDNSHFELKKDEKDNKYKIFFVRSSNIGKNW